ncbi:hypothetical protein AB0F05_37120 [Streptomyces microflavus]|uniref:hypothetical protein n=1 Tax=Streptomyces microflavus TaxID=1919 RepID=UPI0033F3DA6B
MKDARGSLDPAQRDRIGPDGRLAEGNGGVDAGTKSTWPSCRTRPAKGQLDAARDEIIHELGSDYEAYSSVSSIGRAA